MPSAGFTLIYASGAVFLAYILQSFLGLSSSRAMSLSSIRTTNAAHIHLESPAPVAVFIGGTSGIGAGMARAFANHTKGNAGIVIVGRNKAAAEALLASLPSPEPQTNPPVARDFIQSDVTLMKNVDATSKTILAKYPKVNYVLISTGVLTTAGRDETTEGIDKKLAVHYYARWKFLHDLLPAVQKAKDAGEETGVLSVLSAGHGGEIDVDDFGLKKTFSLRNASFSATTYNDLMLESYHEKYPSLKFIHAFPGFVRTQLAHNSPTSFIRSAAFLVHTLGRPFGVSPDECGEYMWNAIYTTATKPGAWRVGSKGEDIGMKKYFGNEEQRRKLWAHTAETVEAALKNAVPGS